MLLVIVLELAQERRYHLLGGELAQPLHDPVVQRMFIEGVVPARSGAFQPVAQCHARLPQSHIQIGDIVKYCGDPDGEHIFPDDIGQLLTDVVEPMVSRIHIDEQIYIRIYDGRVALIDRLFYIGAYGKCRRARQLALLVTGDARQISAVHVPSQTGQPQLGILLIDDISHCRAADDGLQRVRQLLRRVLLQDQQRYDLKKIVHIGHDALTGVVLRDQHDEAPVVSVGKPDIGIYEGIVIIVTLPAARAASGECLFVCGTELEQIDGGGGQIVARLPLIILKAHPLGIDDGAGEDTVVRVMYEDRHAEVVDRYAAYIVQSAALYQHSGQAPLQIVVVHEYLLEHIQDEDGGVALGYEQA